MSKTDHFWQYAKEAMLSACYAQTDEDKQGLFDLARTWTQAALLERASPSHRESPHKASAATGPGNRGYSQQIEGHAGNPGLRSCGESRIKATGSDPGCIYGHVTR